MVGVISLLSNTPNLLKELHKVLPYLTFAQILKPDTDVQFKQSKVIVADFDLLGPYIYNLPHAEWIQGTWAGVDGLLPYITKGTPSYPISRFSGDSFGALMSEYVLANIINYERDMFKIYDNQKNNQWTHEGKINSYRAIGDLTFGILGLGNIGSRIGQNLYNIGGTILGYGRPMLDKSRYKFLENYYTKDTLSNMLRKCDYLINVLPNTTETTGLLNGDILKDCEENQTVFINIGRGNIISEESLINAIEQKWIQAAILDVFEKEPLTNNKLWNLSNVFITPHVAGLSRAKDIAKQFKKNLENFQKNGNIPNKIDFTKGY